MPTAPNYFVWEWLDDAGQIRFIGRGRKENEEHPAAIMFDKRQTLNSPIGHWLCTLAKEPQRSDQVIATPMYESNAEALYTHRFRYHKKNNADLLTTRLFGTRAGGGMPRQVISPDGVPYDSVTQAAAMEGVHACTITRLCAKDGTGWDYI